MNVLRLYFYIPKGTVRPLVRYKSCFSDNSKTAEANLMKFHRKIRHNEKIWHVHDLGPQPKVNRVRGRIVPKIVSQQ